MTEPPEPFGKHRASNQRSSYEVPPEPRSYKGYWIALAVLLVLALCFGGLALLGKKIDPATVPVGTSAERG